MTDDWKKTPCIPGNNSRNWWIRFKGPIPQGLYVCHHCDHRWCKNLDHCFLGTQSDNIKDCVSKKRFRGGCKTIKNGMAKFSAEQVLYIRNSDKSIWELVTEFNVDPRTIKFIKERKTWRWLA